MAMRFPFAARELAIVGAGVLARAVGERLAGRVAVRFHSRRAPEAGAEPMASLARSSCPVVIALAADERALIAAARARGGAEVPRAGVAAANVAVLEETLPFAALAGRAVLVVTNPVELIAELVAARAPTAHVIAFGMGTDRSRIAEALTRTFELPDPGRALAIGGLHWVRPIPVLSALPELAAAVSHDELSACVRILTAAEFVGDRPPLARPAAELTGLLERLLTARGSPEDVSALTPLAGGAACVGGTYDPATGAFTPARMGRLEKPLFAAALAQHRAAVRSLIGAPR
jgi:hypothetical protein